MSNNKYKILLCLTTIILALFFSACSSITGYRREGLALNRAGKYDEAVDYFEKALKKYPRNPELRTMLLRTKLSSYYYHLTLARNFRDENKTDKAIAEYHIALNIFPGNKKIADELDMVMGVKPTPEAPFRSSIKPPVNLKVNTTEKITLNLKNTPIIKIFTMVGKSFNVNFIFDKDFRDFVYSIEVDNIGFFDIINQLCMVGSAKYKILDTSTILVYPDTTFKNRTFGLKGVKVYYLTNTKAEDTKKLVMTVFRDQQILVQEDVNLNSLIIKADSATLREIERFIYAVDKKKSEVELDVEILELNRNIINAIGLDYQDTLSSLSMGSSSETTGSDGKITTTVNPIVKLNKIGDTNFFLTLPSPAVNMLESDADTKIISKPNLRVIDGEEVKFMVGDEVPIPRTQFQAGAAGGVSNIPVTSYEYKPVGLDVKITPTIHVNHDISLKIKLELNFIASTLNGFPIIGKRALETVIRLKEGETSIIGGLIKDEMRGSIKGIPGLAKLPIIGRLFGTGAKDSKQTDLVFSITPRIVRWLNLTEKDREAIWSDTDNENQDIHAPQAPDFEDNSEGTPDTGDLTGPSTVGSSAILITPMKRQIPVNAVSHFTIRFNSGTEITSLSLSGALSGPKAVIEDLKTDFFGGKEDVKILKNNTADSFDLGFTFSERPIRSSVVGQLQIKFLEKGTYTLSVNSASAVGKDRNQLEVKTAQAEIEVD